MLRIKEIFSKYAGDKKYQGIFVLALAGIFLICFSSLFTEKEAEKPEINAALDIEEFRKKKEKELEEFIERIDGVSSCRVMISYKDSGTTLYSFNSISSQENEGERKENEMVIRREDGNEYPITEKTNVPEIRGITVIADGNKGMEVKLARAVSGAAGADIHNVEVIINERN